MQFLTMYALLLFLNTLLCRTQFAFNKHCCKRMPSKNVDGLQGDLYTP